MVKAAKNVTDGIAKRRASRVDFSRLIIEPFGEHVRPLASRNAMSGVLQAVDSRLDSWLNLRYT